jgi:hypothetical protein
MNVLIYQINSQKLCYLTQVVELNFLFFYQISQTKLKLPGGPANPGSPDIPGGPGRPLSPLYLSRRILGTGSPLSPAQSHNKILVTYLQENMPIACQFSLWYRFKSNVQRITDREELKTAYNASKQEKMIKA